MHKLNKIFIELKNEFFIFSSLIIDLSNVIIFFCNQFITSSVEL